MTDELVLLERRGGAALLTLNQGRKRNVLSAALVDALAARYDALEADPSVHAVVLTGAAPAFCAGAELGVLRAAADGQFALVRKVYDGFLRVLHSPLPTIAAVNGPAVGAGFNLALACDLRLAGRSAVFDTRFTKLHLHPGGGHAWLLARAVGPQFAMLATAFGEVWNAEQAKEARLVVAVHDDAELIDAAMAIAQRFDSHESVFTRRVVDTMRKALTIPTHAEALEHETAAQVWSTERPAFRDGLAAMEAAIAAKR
jgi:enoyl-CoA hydratase